MKVFLVHRHKAQGFNAINYYPLILNSNSNEQFVWENGKGDHNQYKVLNVP